MHRVLAPAERAGLVRIDGHQVAFTHPLYAAAAYQAPGGDGADRPARPARRRGRRHGGACPAPRARRGGGRRGRRAGAWIARASRRCVAGRSRRRSRRAGSRWARRRRPARTASSAADPLRPAAVPRRGRHARQARARVRCGAAGRMRRGPAPCTSSRASSSTPSPRSAPTRSSSRRCRSRDDDDELLADIHIGLAFSGTADWMTALEHARTAVALLESRSDAPREKLATALTALVGASLYAGLGADFEACRRAVELEGDAVSVPVADRALSVLFYLEVFTDDFAAAREHLRQAFDLARRRGRRAVARVRAVGPGRGRTARRRAGTLAEQLPRRLAATVRADPARLPRAAERAPARLAPGVPRDSWTSPRRSAREEVRQAAEAGNLVAEIRGAGVARVLRVAAGRPRRGGRAPRPLHDDLRRPERPRAGLARDGRRARRGARGRRSARGRARRRWPRWSSPRSGSAAPGCSPPPPGPRRCCSPPRATGTARWPRPRQPRALRPDRAPARTRPAAAGEGAGAPPAQAEVARPPRADGSARRLHRSRRSRVRRSARKRSCGASGCVRRRRRSSPRPSGASRC